MNILAPTPITYPSDLYSIAGETIELAKPVIGTNEPAPQNFPILLKIFNPVKNAAKPINIIDTIVPDVVVSKPLCLQMFNNICPIEQINPPVQNALNKFFHQHNLDILFLFE